MMIRPCRPRGFGPQAHQPGMFLRVLSWMYIGIGQRSHRGRGDQPLKPLLIDCSPLNNLGGPIHLYALLDNRAQADRVEGH